MDQTRGVALNQRRHGLNKGDAHQIAGSERETSMSTSGVTSRGPKPVPPVVMMRSTGFGSSFVHAVID